MNAFIRRHLDPSDRLIEVLFGLIMALGITGSVRLGREDADSHELVVAILGCNIAWAIVDGAMYVIAELFERGRKARLIASVVASASEDDALELIGSALDDRLPPVTTADERRRLYAGLLLVFRRSRPERQGLRRADVLGGAAAALIILLATLPVLVPFFLVSDTTLAVRLSNTVAIGELFLLGTWWGRIVGTGRWLIGCGLTLVGVALVLVTIALGG